MRIFGKSDYETDISNSSRDSDERASPNYGRTFVITFGVLEIVGVLGVLLWKTADEKEKEFFDNHSLLPEISMGVGLAIAAVLLCIAVSFVADRVGKCVEKYKDQRQVFSNDNSSYQMGQALEMGSSHGSSIQALGDDEQKSGPQKKSPKNYKTVTQSDIDDSNQLKSTGAIIRIAEVNGSDNGNRCRRCLCSSEMIGVYLTIIAAGGAALGFYLTGTTWKSLLESDLPEILANTVGAAAGASFLTGLHYLFNCGGDSSDSRMADYIADYYNDDGERNQLTYQ